MSCSTGWRTATSRSPATASTCCTVGTTVRSWSRWRTPAWASCADGPPRRRRPCPSPVATRSSAPSR
ncbi:hypothetical protein ACFFX0_07045 [Citricoccus parietis]|uniref:Uncharacterized protein n=1 Tax=Citricoccus parietis TaxID=592307 RepID=A0ABV5FWG2_9MICC